MAHTPPPKPTAPARATEITKGARIRLYFGEGWFNGTVEAPYHRSLGLVMDDFEDALDWPASTSDAWTVLFDDGDRLTVSLSDARKSREPVAGHWWVLARRKGD